MSEQNKAVFRRVIEEVFNQGKLATADELGTGYIEHSPIPGQGPGVDGFKQMVQMFRGAFPDLRITLEDLDCGRRLRRRSDDDDGYPQGAIYGTGTDREAVHSHRDHILRIANGKVLGHWGVSDDLSMMQQLGAVPAGALSQA